MVAPKRVYVSETVRLMIPTGRLDTATVPYERCALTPPKLIVEGGRMGHRYVQQLTRVAIAIPLPASAAAGERFCQFALARTAFSGRDRCASQVAASCLDVPATRVLADCSHF